MNYESAEDYHECMAREAYEEQENYQNEKWHNHLQNESCEFKSAVIEYFGLQEQDVTENTKIQADFGQLVNLLAFYQQKYDDKNWMYLV